MRGTARLCRTEVFQICMNVGYMCM